MQTLYYCATGDAEHFNEFGETDSIFEALCSYYDAINHPDEDDEEVEIGYYTVDDNDFKDDYVTLMYHIFEDKE